MGFRGEDLSDWGAGLHRAPLVFALILGACANSAGLEDAKGLDQTGRLFARSYQQVEDLYLDPVPPGAVAASAMQRLSMIDNKLSVIRDVDAIELRYGGEPVARHVRPDDSDPYAWGSLTSQILQEAKQVSTEVAGTPEDKLQQTLFEGMIANLDRFSRYSAPESARDQRAARDGFGGIGVTLDYSNNEVRVTSVIPESPAHHAGLQVEDRIAKIDGLVTASLSRSDVVRRLRGPVDSRVAVTVARPGISNPMDFAVTRGFIVVPTVTSSREDGVAILRVTSFNHQTTQNLAEQIVAARKQMGSALRGVVLDLRGNPGGLLDQSVAVADLFMTDGPIVSTRGRNPESMQFYRAAPDDILAGLPIVALVNGGSASAAEIVAAALQDSGRAVVVGSASYGKGTVQTVLRLPNDGELTLTWAKLVSPAGYILHEHGVIPNICTSGIGDSETEVSSAVRRGTMLAAAGTVAARARKSLDEPGWSELRKTCPADNAEHKAEIEIAKRLLESPALYARALHLEPPTVATRTTATLR
jgi:carboxyl-terminal processing protease